MGQGAADVGTFVVVGQLQRGGADWRCTAELAEGRLAFEVGERVASLGARTVAVAQQAGCVVVSSSAVIVTSRGRELLLVTTAALVGAESGSAAALDLQPTRLGRGAVVVALAKA